MIQSRACRVLAAIAGLTVIAPLAGCAAIPLPPATASNAPTPASDVEARVGAATAAVAQAPRDPDRRLALAQALLRAGRFESARIVWRQALALGAAPLRVTLGLALSEVACGNPAAARSVLVSHGAGLAPVDRGLALALAGDGATGLDVLNAARRSGFDTPRLRQNLAFVLALAGRWRDARDLAALDLPATVVPARMVAWAQIADPSATRARVALLLGAPLRADTGLPPPLPGDAPPSAPATSGPRTLPPLDPAPLPLVIAPTTVAATGQHKAPAG